MKVLQENPYRILGVYANSPIKERVANQNRMKAFLKVGKSVSFPLDLPQYLSEINRSDSLVADAEGKLALPKDQILYAQFWFLKITPIDEIAFNHLISGDVVKAVDLWQKKDCLSSLQNRIVCALLGNNIKEAMACAQLLYTNETYITQFLSVVGGNLVNASLQSLAFGFLDKLSEEVSVGHINACISELSWKQHLSGEIIGKIVDKLQVCLERAKATRKGDPIVRYNAGLKLKQESGPLFSELNEFISRTDLQYQVIADKVGLEILQCGIDYYNGSDECGSAQKAMDLQTYAMSVVVGQVAKDRCKENCDILQKIIKDLPPTEVYEEDKAIDKELQRYCLLPDKICHAVALLNNVKPHLLSIKSKLGASNSYYLKISTRVVSNALSNVIAEVNDAQSVFNEDSPTARWDAIYGLTHVKTVLSEAWSATRIMDGFDMEVGFRKGRYDNNRFILKGLCDQLGVSTSLYASSPAPQGARREPPIFNTSTSTSGRTSTTQQTTSYGNSSSSSSGPDIPWGCVAWAIIGLISLIVSQCN